MFTIWRAHRISWPGISVNVMMCGMRLCAVLYIHNNRRTKRFQKLIFLHLFTNCFIFSLNHRNKYRLYFVPPPLSPIHPPTSFPSPELDIELLCYLSVSLMMLFLSIDVHTTLLYNMFVIKRFFLHLKHTNSRMHWALWWYCDYTGAASWICYCDFLYQGLYTAEYKLSHLKHKCLMQWALWLFIVSLIVAPCIRIVAFYTSAYVWLYKTAFTWNVDLSSLCAKWNMEAFILV